MGFINNKDKVGSSILLLFSLCYLNEALNIPINAVFSSDVFTARTLPIGLSIITIMFCLIHLFLPSGHNPSDSIRETVKGFQWLPCILFVLLMVLYGLTFKFLGFVIATFLFLMAGFYLLQERRIVLSLIISSSLVLSLWFVLTQLFDLYLDNGDLFRLLMGVE